ncbi:MAG: hypothetical protein LBH76_10550 [Propionibacteriaceae bacterium]|jgi:hypothetical protein|nr:hypothetical protein [Propionibacteriaceae bacterium]
MSVDWRGYTCYTPLHAGVPNTLPRAETRAEHNHLMAARPERRRALTELLTVNGVELTADDAGLTALDTWFTANVELSPGDPARLADIWYGVVTDVGLFIGDLAIERCPNLHWVFHTFGRRNVYYQCSVLMGFRVTEPRYSIEPLGSIAVHGYRAAAGLPEERDALVKMMKAIEFAASGEYLD